MMRDIDAFVGAFCVAAVAFVIGMDIGRTSAVAEYQREAECPAGDVALRVVDLRTMQVKCRYYAPTRKAAR